MLFRSEWIGSRLQMAKANFGVFETLGCLAFRSRQYFISTRHRNPFDRNSRALKLPHSREPCLRMYTAIFVTIWYQLL